MGRNDGFIIVTTVDYLVTRNITVICYYAKVQEFEFDVILSHFILKELKCGPQRCFFFWLDNNQYSSYLYHQQAKLGVITEEVDDFMTAKVERNYRSGRRMIQNRDQFFCDTFLMTVVVHLGKFSPIPDNFDNWGLLGMFQDGDEEYLEYDESEEATPVSSEPRHCIVDFSSYSYHHKGTFQSSDAFKEFWTDICRNFQRYSRFPTSQLLVGVSSALEHQHECFPWLQSKTAFQETLQLACDQTAEWLHHCAQQIIASRLHDSVETVIDAVPEKTVSAPVNELVPYRRHPRLHHPAIAPYDHTLYDAYEKRVEHLQTALDEFSVWFPFPTPADKPSKRRVNKRLRKKLKQKQNSSAGSSPQTVAAELVN